MWDEEYGRVGDLKIFYHEQLVEYEDVEAAETRALQQQGFSNEFQYWKNCYTGPISEETFPFEDQGAKGTTFDECALKCIKISQCMAFNWLEKDGRCYLRGEWARTVMGEELARSSVAQWKPWSGHRLTLPDRSKLPKTPPTGKKRFDPETIPIDVSYKWNNANQLRWFNQDNSAWAAVNLEEDYCSLGDKIIIGTESPTGA